VLGIISFRFVCGLPEVICPNHTCPRPSGVMCVHNWLSAFCVSRLFFSWEQLLACLQTSFLPGAMFGPPCVNAMGVVCRKATAASTHFRCLGCSQDVPSPVRLSCLTPPPLVLATAGVHAAALTLTAAWQPAHSRGVESGMGCVMTPQVTIMTWLITVYVP
jgi:hypothetical protein